MRPRASLLAALLFACIAAGAGTWAYRQHTELAFERRRVALLEDENTRLHALVGQQEKTISANSDAARRRPIEEAVTRIRGLEFSHSVTYDVLTRAGFKNLLEEKLSKQYSDTDFKNYATGMAAFGLLEPNYPLKEKYIALLGEQVAALYDQHQHKLFMFENASLDDIQNRVVLAHELTHALQDQNFGLLKMPLEVKTDDDLALATSALIEGDATLVMDDYELQNFRLQDLHRSITGLLSQNMKQFQDAPRILRDSLTFPYVRGMEFCEQLRDEGGYAAISDAFKNPPTSTSQILHPEEYLAHEEPIRIDWQDTSVLGEKPVEDNVLGEFGTRILLSQFLGDTAGIADSQGWRGDRYLAYADGKALVWKTIWVDDAHAENFHEALKQYLTARFKAAFPSDNGAFSPLGSTETFETPNASGVIKWSNEAHGIIFIWAEDKKLLHALFEKFGEEYDKPEP